MVQSVIVVAAVAELGIAVTATALAWGSGVLEGRGGMLALAAIIVGGGAAGMALVSSRMRRVHVEIANLALGRARNVEERLFHVALAREWRAEGPVHFQDALARLESRAPDGPGERTFTGS
jgi:hypothetical protein